MTKTPDLGMVITKLIITVRKKFLLIKVYYTKSSKLNVKN